MTKKSFASLCVKEQKDQRTTTPHQLPIYATSSFEFENINQGIDIFEGKEKGHVYGRYGNPTIETVAHKLALLETYGLDIEAKALMFSSGMSAISSLLFGVLKTGDKVLTQGNLYGGTTELLLKILGPLGIETIMTDLQQLDKVEDLLKKDDAIKMVYFETPANPTLACVDIEGIANLTKKYNRLSAIDSTFCTPYIQQPLKYGIDFVIHSSTKYLNGHGNSISGVVIGTDIELMEKKVWGAMKLTGTNCNPWDAWLTNNGLKTLALRMDQHCKNAMTIAEYLEQHPKIERVNYNGLSSHPDHELAKKQMTGFGGMLSFELKGGLDAGIKFMNNIKFCSLAPTLGDVDTLILHPASSSHINVDKEVRERNGITDGLIRLSVGIEGVEDLIGDLEQAF
ncbi:MAG: PLP-dependent aspartate aminotransferase family protein [Saprospiraceae bacterium]